MLVLISKDTHGVRAKRGVCSDKVVSFQAPSCDTMTGGGRRGKRRERVGDDKCLNRRVGMDSEIEKRDMKAVRCCFDHAWQSLARQKEINRRPTSFLLAQPQSIYFELLPVCVQNWSFRIRERYRRMKSKYKLDRRPNTSVSRLISVACA